MVATAQGPMASQDTNSAWTASRKKQDVAGAQSCKVLLPTARRKVERAASICSALMHGRVRRSRRLLARLAEQRVNGDGWMGRQIFEPLIRLISDGRSFYARLIPPWRRSVLMSVDKGSGASIVPFLPAHKGFRYPLCNLHAGVHGQLFRGV